MPIKTRRYRKRNNKSRRTRKNKTIRRYKKQMKGGNDLIKNEEEYLIKNEEELKKSWDKTETPTGRFLIKSWLANDGMGTKQEYHREGMTYEELKQQLNYYFKNMNKEGYIKEEHY